MPLQRGAVLALLAVFFNIAVFLQPLLPTQYQLAVLCQRIIQVIEPSHLIQSHDAHQHHGHHATSLHHYSSPTLTQNHHATQSQHDAHASHPCFFCTAHQHVANPDTPPLRAIVERLLSTWFGLFVPSTYAVELPFFAYLLPPSQAPPTFT